MPIRWPLVGALVLVLSVPLACAARRTPARPGPMHIVVGPLPQCPYGIPYERPLRIDLLRGGAVVASATTAGTYLGPASQELSLYAGSAVEGEYELRFGWCPSMLVDPRASVLCEDVDWIRSRRVHLVPEGLERPAVVRYYRWRARCLQPDAELPAREPPVE